MHGTAMMTIIIIIGLIGNILSGNITKFGGKKK